MGVGGALWVWVWVWVWVLVWVWVCGCADGARHVDDWMLERHPNYCMLHGRMTTLAQWSD